MSTYKKTNTRPKSSTQTSKKNTPQKKNTLKAPPKKKSNPNSIVNQILPDIFTLLAFAVAFCLVFTEQSGFIGKSLIKPLLCGFFGWGSVIVAPVILIIGLLWKKSIETDSVFLKLVSSVFILLSFSVIIHVLSTPENMLSINPKTLWVNGNSWVGGGVVGGFISTLFLKGVGKALTLCIFIPLILIFTTFLLGYTPYTAFVAIKDKLREGKEKFEEYDEEQKVWHSIKFFVKITQ